MAKEDAQGPRERRHFTAEFKLEAVRRVAERRAARVPMTQIARELDVRDDLLRKWQRQVGERAGAPPADVFPGSGRIPAEEDEVRRLRRELARAQQEIAFLKSAAVGSTGQCTTHADPLFQGTPWRRSAVPACRRTSGSRSGKCGRPATRSR